MSQDNKSAKREKAFSFLDFPQDDHIWYVRWLGAIFKSATRSTTPMVQVHIERLGIAPDLATNLKEVRDFLQRREQPQQQHMRAVKASAAALPALHIGGLFLNGTPIGSLRLPTKTIWFNLQADKPRIMKAGDLHQPLPEGWGANYSHRLINLGEFQLPALDSNCILLSRQVKGRQIEVVIPCTEVFRSLYARESKIAREMLASSWRDAANRIVNLALTRPVEDDVLQVVLRRGMSERFPEYVANLVLTSVGWQAANNVHGSIPLGATSWYLKAPLPFDMESFRLKGRMLLLREDKNSVKFLCTEILGTSYPLVDKSILFIRENDGGKGKKRAKARNIRPYRKRYSEILEEDEPIPSTSVEDPTAGSQSVFHNAEGSGWLDPVEKRKLEKTESLEHDYNRDEDEHHRLRQTSAGTPSWRRSSSAPGQFRSQAEYSEKLARRFKEVLELVKVLNKLKQIDSWQLIAPSSKQVAAYQDGIALWKLPNRIPNVKGNTTYRPWAVMDELTPRARTMLVLEIRAKGRRLLWFDIEPKGTGNRALILRLVDGQTNIEKIVNHVRTIGVASRGLWHLCTSESGVSVPGADKEVRWRHCHSGKRLNRGSALQSLLELLKP